MNDATKIALRKAARTARSEYSDAQRNVSEAQSLLAHAMRALDASGRRCAELEEDAAMAGIDLSEPTPQNFATGGMVGERSGAKVGTSMPGTIGGHASALADHAADLARLKR